MVIVQVQPKVLLCGQLLCGQYSCFSFPWCDDVATSVALLFLAASVIPKFTKINLEGSKSISPGDLESSLLGQV